MIANTFSYIQAANKTTQCKKEGNVERNSVFFLLLWFLSQYLNNSWSAIWQDHHPEMMWSHCVCFCHFMTLSVKKYSQDHCSCFSKTILAVYFCLLRCFSWRTVFSRSSLMIFLSTLLHLLWIWDWHWFKLHQSAQRFHLDPQGVICLLLSTYLVGGVPVLKGEHLCLLSSSLGHCICCG